MSIVIALIVVLVVAGLIVNFYPKPIKPTLAQGEILTPEPTPIEPVVIAPQPKKRGPKPKVQTEAKTMAAKKPKKKAD